MRSSCTSLMDTKSKSSVLRQKLRKRSVKMALWRWSQRLEWYCYKPRNAWSRQKLEETENDSTQSCGRGAWPCQCSVKTSKIRGLDFRPLVYRTMREYISGENRASRLWSFVTAVLEKKTLSWVLSISVVEWLVKKKFQQKIKEWKSTQSFKKPDFRALKANCK